MAGFTHLHVASGFSVRYGASSPEQLARRAAERGMDALALTDRDTLAGAVRFAKATARFGLRPVYGTELAVGERAEPESAVRRRRTPVKGGAFVDESAQRAVFLARAGAAGWAQLCQLITAAHATSGERPRLGWTDLGGDGLTVLLGADSEVGRSLAAGRPDRAARLLRHWREVFGDELRLAVTASGPLRDAARMLGLAATEGVRPVLTNAVRYADPDQGPVVDVLDAARRLVPIDERAGLDDGTRWLRDRTTMAEVAERIAEAAGYRRATAHRLLEVTEETAAACRVDPEDDLGIGSVHFPEPELVGAGARTAARVLRSRCVAGMVSRRYDADRDRWRRLAQELRIIEGLGFSSYFLTVARVAQDVREMGVRVAARGSGAGSLVAHLLGIAQADPVEHGLLMERFLSPRRAALPDIDIDVESARRIEVYHAILDRFGPERVATVAMPETYRVRHAIRDVGAALGQDPAETDRLAKAFPHIRARDARTALAELPELREIREEIQGAADGPWGERFWSLVEALDGLPRGVAMHPCGVLLSDGSLRARTPVVPTSGEHLPMAQFDKEDVEELGLLKLDVLGVRMQSAMAHAVAEVERASGERIELDAVPADDPETYELIRSAETLGCFQIESPGQRDLVGRLQPRTFHDLVVDISLFRPGPVAADMVRPFIEARHGRRPARYPHPDLEPALRETYGVVVFHEQLIRIISVLTGCDRALADEARRALSDERRRGRVRAWFAREAAGRGYAAEVVERTWEIVEAFGSYGFCKAHAVAFAVPTYQSAWLKAHHPAAFYAGLLAHDPGMYPKRLLLADARRRGVPVLPLDVNRSGVTYQIELESDSGVPAGSSAGGPAAPSPSSSPSSSSANWGLRLALYEVQGISEADARRIVAGQPYDSLTDLWRRARPPRPVAEALARVGALDGFGGNRRDTLLHIQELHRQQRGPGAREGQLTLGEAAVPQPAGLPDLDRDERLGAELGVLGMDASRHLMSDHAAFLRELGAWSARTLDEARHGDTVLVAGAKSATQTPPIRSGRRVIFSTLDDGTGLVDCAFFDDSHAACAHTVFHSWLLLVRGVVQRRGPRSLSVVGSAAWDLAELIELRRTGGLAAVTARLAADAGERDPRERNAAVRGTGERAGGEEPVAADRADEASDPTGGRRIELPTGYRMHPWADLRPAGEPAKSPSLRKMWHSSPGSAG
ncbi:DNA polymerase III subunit alpha [Streptomyces oceani]|uniref:DNA polymerase III subunit alpha n=1 Tax=Streptomyces oceani TaxID=1075402 RepID=A0A1E7KGX1_9ACTN|nr:DNA polymerase III subunit alpha [Streptomyces oceani]OEV03179.1 DNA polymerase III subunit alpha [Streptomyces oceani]